MPIPGIELATSRSKLQNYNHLANTDLQEENCGFVYFYLLSPWALLSIFFLNGNSSRFS